MTTRTLAVVSAGISVPSSTRLLAEQLAAAAGAELAARGVAVRPVFLDLREHAHDVTNHLLTGFAPAGLRQAIEAVREADGLIAVTPIFNASYSGLFKSFFDVLDDRALADTPVLIAATGGTARHSLALEYALRPMFAHLHARVVGTSVFAATGDWAEDPTTGQGRDGAGALRVRIRAAAAELAAEVARSPQARAIDPFELTTDMESLLASGE